MFSAQQDFDAGPCWKALRTQYAGIDDTRRQKAPAAVAAIDDLLAKTDETTVSLSHVYLLEKALIVLLTREELVPKYHFWLGICQEMAGESKAVERLAIKEPDLATVSEASLRETLQALLDELYRRVTLFSAYRQRQGTVLFQVIAVMSLLYLIFIVVLFFRDGKIPPLIYVVVAGSIGGMLGLIRRTQNAWDSEATLLNYLDVIHDRTSMFLAPTYGAIFSVILLLFFAAGLLKGDIFPTIQTSEALTSDNGKSVSEIMGLFFHGTYPVGGANCAKLILWSFIAGFAERFVPDSLDRLIKRSEKTEAKP
jgi:hypothetical protein